MKRFIVVLLFFSFWTISLSAQSLQPAPTEFKIWVDYSKTLQQGLDEWHCSGSGAVPDKQISSSVKVAVKKAEISLKIFDFDQNISSEEALKKMAEAGYRPALMIELLALCLANVATLEPNKQFPLFPILALGSSWHNPKGGEYVPFLVAIGDKHYFYFRNIKTYWRSNFHFLGVLK
jgi:hypothetical protein